MIQSLTISLITIGIFLLSSFVPNQSLSESIKRGKEVYVLLSELSHGGWTGNGGSINPPVAKADYLKRPNKTLIDVILNGQFGEVIVNGKKYNYYASQEYLSDVQIADVLN